MIESTGELPHNLEAEQALLGALLVNNSGIDKTIFLKPEHFFDPLHARIYSAICSLVAQGRGVDPVKISSYFKEDESLIEVGGLAYLVRLANSAPTVFNPEDYARTICDDAVRRELIAVAEDTIKQSRTASVDDPVVNQIERLEQRVYYMAQGSNVGVGFRPFSGPVQDNLERVSEARKSPNGLAGVTTGLRSVDAKIGGLNKTDLIVLAGRPSMGKTSLAINMSFAAANEKYRGNDKGAGVGFFSMEMSSDQIANRIVASFTKISSEKTRRGLLNDDESKKFIRASIDLSPLPIFLDDSPSLSVATLLSRARRLKRTEGIGLLVVDYLQLMQSSRNDGRVNEVSEISRGLKRIAKELELPVLAISQLSRQCEQRENKRPLLSDLRESGTIEQDADLVLFVYRDSYYLDREAPPEGADFEKLKEWEDRWERSRGSADLIIAKNRHGPTGIVRLGFNEQLTTFTDVSGDDVDVMV